MSDYEDELAFKGVVVGAALGTIFWAIIGILWYWVFG